RAGWTQAGQYAHSAARAGNLRTAVSISPLRSRSENVVKTSFTREIVVSARRDAICACPATVSLVLTANNSPTAPPSRSTFGKPLALLETAGSFRAKHSRSG